MLETSSRLPGSPLPASAASDTARTPSFETLDRLGRAVTARLTHGISPHALYAAWFDWPRISPTLLAG